MLSAIELDRADGWVKVSERLPEWGQDVLLSDGNEIVTGAYYNDGIFVSAKDRTFYPTHWMPLPNKPNKQQGD